MSKILDEFEAANVEDMRRELIAYILEHEKDRDDDWLIGCLISECGCSADEACQLVANNKADGGYHHEDR